MDFSRKLTNQTETLNQSHRKLTNQTETLNQSHMEGKPFKCEICTKRFTEAGSLTKHKLIHTVV